MAEAALGLSELSMSLKQGKVPVLDENQVQELVSGIENDPHKKAEMEECLKMIVSKLKTDGLSEEDKLKLDTDYGYLLDAIKTSCKDLHDEIFNLRLRSSVSSSSSQSAPPEQQDKWAAVRSAILMVAEASKTVESKLRGTYADPRIWVDKTKLFFKEKDESGQTGWDHLKVTLEQQNIKVKALLHSVSESIHHKNDEKKSVDSKSENSDSGEKK